MLELHCHTTYSDGTLTPTQLVKAAVRAGVKALAITDHDTVGGWEEAIAAARPYDLEIVPGIELSTVHRGKSLHILGFYPNAAQLIPPLRQRVEGRRRRAQKIAAKLAELGYPITLPNLGEGVAPGRPHIAKALVDAGYFTSVREAFDCVLGDSQPAYVQYEKFSIVEGIALLRDCGAIPVWAHPYLFRGGDVEDILEELVAAGLMGIEVYHPSQSAYQRKTLATLCQQYGLLMTGGSDYHGLMTNGKEETTLNQLHLPLSLLQSLKSLR
ncbi:MAG TPA: PHP domain-containing protein [Oscillatoriales cyanobacterium M4454_W2019_049]|nr:PHP domain-containing protein [Oscillatoriales cyanobacterium M4454_W2019_049]